eukprot:Tamp_35602.p1 GENE.Tamp_35602~~Tamp_35602.p1  ORF type:complete len:113 (-),score=17.15 Tamp_35602:234-548(-)
MSRWFGRSRQEAGSPDRAALEDSQSSTPTPVKGARGQRGTPGASESAEAAAGPQTLVPKIEALKAHIAQMRANLKTWDEEFVGELEKCLRDDDDLTDTAQRPPK